MSDIPQSPEEIVKSYKKRQKIRLLWWVPAAVLVLVYLFDIFTTLKISPQGVILAKFLICIALAGLLIWKRPDLESILKEDKNSNKEDKRLLAESYELSVQHLNQQDQLNEKERIEKLKELNEKLKNKT